MFARIGVFIFLVFLCAPPIAQAAVLNGGFENVLSDWGPYNTAVNSNASASATGSSETGHPHYAKLYVNAQPNMVWNPVWGKYEPVGLGTAYAGISQVTEANAGDILSFDYYNTSLNYEVSAAFTLDISTTWENIVTEILPTSSTWTTYQITIPKSESYNIAFMIGGQSELGETGTLKVDNVRITSVPEPGAMSLLGIGALTCGLFAWRRRR
jgi:hypothetical protein